MWLLSYWWQAIILIILYIFIYLLFKEMYLSNGQEPAAVLMVINNLIDEDEDRTANNEMIFLYPQKPLELQGEKLYVVKNSVFLKKGKETTSQEIKPGEIFDFAGGSLQLVRWEKCTSTQ